MLLVDPVCPFFLRLRPLTWTCYALDFSNYAALSGPYMSNFFSDYTLFHRPVVRSIFQITLLLVDLLSPPFLWITPSIDLLCTHIVPIMLLLVDRYGKFSLFFIFISVPPKKRKQTDNTNRPKGIGRLYLEDVYTFDAEQLTSDFVLTHGWYYLVMHQFDIHETTTLLKPLYNSVQKSKERNVLYCKIVKLSNKLKRLGCLV